MNRCKKSKPSARLRALGLLALASLACGGAAAQAGSRSFPEEARRGVLVVTQPPEVRLDGRTDRLAPGARILSTSNLLVMSGTLVGQQLLVNYTRTPQGQVHQVWILTPEEARERRAGAASNGGLSMLPAWLQAPTPATDNGLTPYKDLPPYPGPQ